MKNIIILKPKNDSLVAQLVSFYETLKNAEPNEQLSFDLSNLTWACPLLVLL